MEDLRAAPRDDEVADDVRRLANAILPRSAELAALVTERVLEVVPELAPLHNAKQVAVVRESTDQNVGAIFATLAFGVEAAAIEPPVGTLTLLRQTVAGGGDVTTILHAYRVGHACLWRLWADHVAARVQDADRLHLVLRYSSDHIFAFVNSACERLVAVYREHFADGQMVGRAGSPREYIERLITTDPVDLDAAASRLGYDIGNHHVAAVAVPLADGADARAALGRLAKAASGGKLLAHAVGDGSWWGWLGWPAAPEPSTLAALSRVALTGVLVGMGEPGHGREGFRRSHLQAGEAERTTRLSPQPKGGVVRHRDVEVAGLLCADPVRARQLAADRLGRLAGRDEATARLRETVRAYLACGRSTARTAETLHVHQKTVTYRLARAAELLGHPVAESSRELEAALLIDLTLHGE